MSHLKTLSASVENISTNTAAVWRWPSVDLRPANCRYTIEYATLQRARIDATDLCCNYYKLLLIKLA